jgi:hypothetical protein
MEITQLPVAGSIDPQNDTFPIVTANVNTTQQINRNTFLGLSSAPVGLTDSQTLTSKTLTSPTISGPTFSGTLSGTYTIGGTPTFPSSVVQLTSSQTLTNKTLTSPTITSPTITNATISADTVTGFTTSNNGTIYGISVTGGTIGSAAYGAGSISSTAIATNGVAASNLATSAITLGYAQITGNITTTSTTFVQATGLSVTVTIPAGGRRIKVTVYTVSVANSVSANGTVLSLWDGTVGSGTQIQQTNVVPATNIAMSLIWAGTPSAGSKTYNVGFSSVSSGTSTITAGTTSPAFILVEAI